MEIEVIKKIIKNNLKGFESRNKQTATAEKYYRNENDILREDADDTRVQHKKTDDTNPLRNADNRVSHPWHRLLVNQKASYAMTTPPKFDVKDKRLNDEVTKLLGDSYSKIAKDLAVNASNAGIAWLHIWRDENKQNFFRYAVVDSKQIVPIFSKKLGNELIGVLRIYDDYNESGDVITVYEYWNDAECAMFAKRKGQTVEDIEAYNAFNLIDISTGTAAEQTNTYKHGWEDIPFIPFRNNADELSDLALYKDLIDVYDKIYAGFVNDLDDVQQIIFVLTNYGGQDKKEFLDDLQKYKMVKVDDFGDGTKSGVDTLAVDIPSEARDKLLEITRESIFVNGQGVDPQKNIGQNNSGAALNHMYSLLELKTSAMETEFHQGFAKLVRFILKYSNANADIEITQTWKRNVINNELEKAQTVSLLANVTSKETIAKANPLVANWEDELEAQRIEDEEEFSGGRDYRREEPIDLGSDEDDE